MLQIWNNHCRDIYLNSSHLDGRVRERRERERRERERRERERRGGREGTEITRERGIRLG